jgi:hypothetical protein
MFVTEKRERATLAPLVVGLGECALSHRQATVFVIRSIFKAIFWNEACTVEMENSME